MSKFRQQQQIFSRNLDAKYGMRATPYDPSLASNPAPENQMFIKCPNYDDPLSIFSMHNFIASNYPIYKGKNKRNVQIPIELIFPQINKAAIDICSSMDKFIEKSHFCPFYRAKHKANECSNSWINGFCTNHWKIIFRLSVIIEEGIYSLPNEADLSKSKNGTSIIKFCYSETIHQPMLIFPFFSLLPDIECIDSALSATMSHLDAEHLDMKDDLIGAFKCFLVSDDTYDKTARESWISDMAKIYQSLPIDTTLSIYHENDSSQAIENINLVDLSLLDIPLLASIGTMQVGTGEYSFLKIANNSICILKVPKDKNALIEPKLITYWYQSGNVLKAPVNIKGSFHRDAICAKNPHMSALYQFAIMTQAYESPTINGRSSFMYPLLALLNSKPKQLIIELGNCKR
jgi:hypothetical protein